MPTPIGANLARRKLANDELVLCLGVNQMRTPNVAMIAAAAKRHGKAMGVGGVREDLPFQTWLAQLGVRYLTSGSDVGYILSAGRPDVRQQRSLPLKPACPLKPA